MQPPLLEKELVNIFIDNLQGSFFEKMIDNMSSSFFDLVKIGERVENGLKSGKIQNASSSLISENESLSSSQEEEGNKPNVVMEDVEYSYGKPIMPRVSYRQPLIFPHLNRQAQGQGYKNHHQN